jgi:hypothetical protein
MTGVVIPHMGSADVDTRKKMAELCKLPLVTADAADIRRPKWNQRCKRRSTPSRSQAISRYTLAYSIKT